MSAAVDGITLAQLGWSTDRALAFAPLTAEGLLPGRVISSGAGTHALTRDGLTEVIVQRRFARAAFDRTAVPAIGDWLALEPISEQPRRAATREILPRTGTFLRHRPFDGTVQVLAANIDIAFLVSGLDHDLNLRRIERYLVLTLAGRIRPVVVLNKADVAVDLARAVAAVHAVAPGTRVVATSALAGAGLDELRDLLGPGVTGCLLGSSGVGKSTITNVLLGEERQVVRALRAEDSRGRHTTTSRELFMLPGGGLLVDTPGLRTVGVLGDGDALSTAFDDVETLAYDCRFTDCRHDGEPGCAVRAAIDAGRLPRERLASHQKLSAERRQAELRLDVRARREEDRRWGRTYKQAKDELRRRKGEVR